ncbi:arginine repressor [Chlamydia ibidis]|uniref:Arginine repressor n=2 Tax=Chlamydia ibidis TaxID=1405396 RepID=S7J542_9CHLA|nr:arginine repressor [Chlamydia ibidis]EPP35544.1 arginine repressor [Chlamydia ibidis]EQM62626.1 arginine repressor [Chlamydia ibidis 10-1398/6]
MEKKTDVGERLKEILMQEGAATQEEICIKLGSLGIDITQSSISRWLRKVGAIRKSTEHGAYYSLPHSQDDLRFHKLVFAVHHNNSLIVVRTAPGSASWIAGLIDKEFSKKILGTLAGDDTIFVSPIQEDKIAILSKEIGNFLRIFLS